MKNITSVVSALLISLTLVGCGANPSRNTYSAYTPSNSSQLSDGSIKSRIYQQHQDWKGTRYAWGGTSKSGVDCSGLVVVTFRDQLGVNLPRTTAQQSQVGSRINRHELSAGDLVFFKTDEKGRHVGIYIEEGKFLHASTSKGVMISHLNDYYWQDKYWHARRIDF